MGFADVTTKNTGFGAVTPVSGGFGGVSTKIGVKGTSDDLYNLATQSGFQKDADRVLQSQSGEDTKKIFSGGFITDIFDVLNSLQYGVTGLLKGKSFSEGVKTRQSFSDKDALGDNGLPGVIGGIALDIAVDPLTYIAPYTILKKVPMLSKVATAVKELAFGKKVEKVIQETGKTYQALEGGTKLGKYLGDKFAWMFGVDPAFKKGYEKSIKNIAVGTQNVAKMAKGISQLTPEIAAKILTKDETGRIARVPLEELQKILKPEELAIVQPAWNKIDEIGKQAVDLGLLSKEKYEENLGEYIKNAYTEYEQAKNKGLFGFMKLGVKGIKKRVEGLTPEKMKELGQIDNPAYLLFKSVFDLQKDVENAKLFKETAEKFGSEVMQEGFKQLPKGIRMSDLSGKFVPENIFKVIQEITEPAKDMIGKNIMGLFKFNKVILNPATHARNIMSNSILNWWKLGIGPWRLDKYASTIQDIATHSEWVTRAEKVGYNIDTFAANEIKSMLDSPEALGIGKKFGNTWNNIRNKLGDLYQGEENVAKLTAFKEMVGKGMTDEQAWKAAESATFNYAQVTPFVRKLRTALWGYPFITFSLKSAPIAVETALKAPQRISAFGKIKNAIENASDIKETAAERASEPPYIRDGFYIKLPIKDKNGNSAYFDLTYIIPFGDLVSGNLFQRQVSRETGVVESIPSAILSNAPLFNFLKEISRNQNFYGDKIWQESASSEKQLGDLMLHLTKTYSPPLIGDQLPGGYKTDGTRRQKGFIQALNPQEKATQQRTLMEEMLRQVGAKIQPIDVDIQQNYQEWNKKKALETLLREKGIIKEFSTSYIPKK